MFAVLFFFIGTLNLIIFTSTYIYELPSHRCPYCILQKEYHYIGYIFYISLFLSTAFGISSFIYKGLMKKEPIFYLLNCLVFTLTYFLISMFYPIRYFFINNTWL
jgi:ABC-type antimicrobial peptide transport system permease subunit